MDNVDQLKKAFHENAVKKRYLYRYCNPLFSGVQKITRKAYPSHHSVVTVIPRTLADAIGIEPGTDIEFRLIDTKTLALSPVQSEARAEK